MGNPNRVESAAEEAERSLDALSGATSLPPSQTAEGAAQTAVAKAEPLSAQDSMPPIGQHSPAAVPVEHLGASPKTEEISELKAQLEREVQRNKSFEGRIESQLKPALSENKEMKRRLKELEDEIAALRTPPTPPVPGFKKHLREGEADALGSDTLDLNARVARGEAEDVVDSRMAAIRAEIARNEEAHKAQIEALEAAHRATVSERFWSSLDAIHPGIREIDSKDDPRWREFLASEDDNSGLIYRDLAVKAIGEGNLDRMSKIVGTFFRQNNISGTKDSRLRNLAKPDSAAPGAATTAARGAPKGRTYTESEYRTLYADITTGRLVGKMSPEALAALEKDIEAASFEGRITAG